MRMAHSAALRQWICGCVSWYLVCSLSMKFFTALEASLSNQCSHGLRPCRVSILYISSSVSGFDCVIVMFAFEWFDMYQI